MKGGRESSPERREKKESNGRVARSEAREKTKRVDASVGTRQQTNAGGNECFMEPPGCFLPGWKATIRESARQTVCVCWGGKEE